jgi:ubiquinone/menaquinone biosynthesis C-methylase UbiE
MLEAAFGIEMEMGIGMPAFDVLRTKLGFAKPFLEALFSIEARLSERWVSGAHRRLFLAQWGVLPVPEFFEHKIGLYWMWRANRMAHWVERGAFTLLAMEPGCKALELCCGDGFNAHFFYSSRVSSMLSVDFDPKAIAYARKHFRVQNVTYRLADIRTQMPEGIFDNIVWDAAIEHFTESEIADLMANIKKRLTPTGTLSGLPARSDVRQMLPDHAQEEQRTALGAGVTRSARVSRQSDPNVAAYRRQTQRRAVARRGAATEGVQQLDGRP